MQIFHASVRDNVTLFDPPSPTRGIVEVLDDLGLGDWLARQPQGLDTVLVAGGGLSAGEAQLLAFARVFLKDPGLVVLDEASSRLDPATDRLIERGARQAAGPRAGGARAHRDHHRPQALDRAPRRPHLILEPAAWWRRPSARRWRPTRARVFAGLLRAGVEEALA